MKVNYSTENMKLMIESENVSEVLQVLSLFQTHKEAQVLEVTVPEIKVPEVVKSLPLVKKPTSQEVKPVIVTNVYDKLERDIEEPRKTLIFYKCKDCGSVSFHMGLPTDKVTCYYCKDTRSLDPVHKGSYTCTCGTHSSFLMEDSVSELSCKNKDCDKKLVMLWDNGTDSYIGSIEVF